MSRHLVLQPLTAKAFAPFGEVLEVRGAPDKIINQGMCGRHHDLADLDFGQGRAGISVFDATPRALPFKLEMVERHPLGAQAFLPMHQNPYLVVVAPDNAGQPGPLQAFLAGPGQGVNYRRNTWHAVCCPLSAPGLFAVVDRIGDGDNLEEHWFDQPWEVVAAKE
ncbi:MAG TPA: ureidoglycolate lyase [Sulfitobacter sp.]|uniref:ureidoglycolate lyase n=1 Tax=Sulfitobacter dubius TaxID=218673 RepID=UPI000E9E1AA6|nr:ureidoglycolate lyase [Sulfitobacter sp.]|tara:strand:+ start:150 stop:644 length:495 start_codon:yes stop_codon:yes gene_type:complete